MGKRLLSRGNGWTLIVNKNLIKLVRLDPQKAELQFKIKNKTLYIRNITPDDPEYSTSLIKKFIKQNSSWGLYFPNSILDVLSINPEVDKLEIEIEDDIIVIKKET